MFGFILPLLCFAFSLFASAEDQEPLWRRWTGTECPRALSRDLLAGVPRGLIIYQLLSTEPSQCPKCPTESSSSIWVAGCNEWPTPHNTAAKNPHGNQCSLPGDATVPLTSGVGSMSRGTVQPPGSSAQLSWNSVPKSRQAQPLTALTPGISIRILCPHPEVALLGGTGEEEGIGEEGRGGEVVSLRLAGAGAGSHITQSWHWSSLPYRSASPLRLSPWTSWCLSSRVTRLPRWRFSVRNVALPSLQWANSCFSRCAVLVSN